MSKQFKAWLAFAGVSFFWGTTFLAIRIGVECMPPALMAGIRHFIGGCLICFYFFVVKKTPIPNWQQIKVYTINGILMLVIGNGLVTWAEKYLTSGLAALICTLTPLSIIGVNALVGSKKEKISAMGWVGIALCLVAQLFIFGDNLSEFANPNYVLGIIAMLIAIMGWGFGSIYSKNHGNAVNPFLGAGLQMLTAGIILIAFGSIAGEWGLFKSSTTGWLAIGYLVVFGSLIGYGSYMYVLKELPATIVSTYAYINTVVAVILGWLYLDEKLNMAILLAMVLTIAGVWLVKKSVKTL